MRGYHRIQRGVQESLTLRCPGGASKGGAGALAADGCKQRRCGMSFEASPCGLRWRMPPSHRPGRDSSASALARPADHYPPANPPKPQYPSDRSQIAQSSLGKVSNRALGCAPKTNWVEQKDAPYRLL
ncbi:hypothetical protein B5E41_00790 [Rhizobium esperanzae]|uniref:Uncharacterized protein n=1 Tax=Rhizobium esperanzae TaxID=1967781 RepID=A0A246E1I4_9HYPH|nr:hypothetical protein B5E41_00790 [Rhizobium esperanzae]